MGGSRFQEAWLPAHREMLSLQVALQRAFPVPAHCSCQPGQHDAQALGLVCASFHHVGSVTWCCHLSQLSELLPPQVGS